MGVILSLINVMKWAYGVVVSMFGFLRDDANFFPYPVGSNIKVGSNTLTVGSNMILMFGSNAMCGRYIVRIRKLTAKPYFRVGNIFSADISMLHL